MTDWRALLYPLGFLASLLFTTRFMVQWIQSERSRRSHVTPLFWQLSLVANVLLVIHSIIQVQYHVALVQGFNGVISWRNLNLMGTPKRQ